LARVKLHDCRTAPSPRRVRIFLAESPWVGGPAYSVADITALVAVDFAGWLKLELPPECVHARAWHADASRRPSALA
jgi:glutathione S-transferase